MRRDGLNPCEPQGQTTPISDTIAVVQLKTREEVLVAREAFHKGGLWRHAKFLDGRSLAAVDDREYAAIAAEKYPMPKITVPRVVTFDGLRYRFINGRFERKSVGAGWYPSSTFADIAGLRALLGLIDNPTCEVDA